MWDDDFHIIQLYIVYSCTYIYAHHARGTISLKSNSKRECMFEGQQHPSDWSLTAARAAPSRAPHTHDASPKSGRSLPAPPSPHTHTLAGDGSIPPTAAHRAHLTDAATQELHLVSGKREI